MEISEALALAGIEDPASVAQARSTLNALKITNPNRERMSREKLPRMKEALELSFALHCPNAACVARARATGKPGLTVRRTHCPICAGSNTGRATQEMLAACRRAGIRRVCLVGGSPGVREELERQFGNALRITLVDGTQTPSSTQARAHVRSHDVTVILGASELSHKLSNTYEAHRQEGAVITVARRGVEAIAAALTFHAQHRGQKG